MNEIDRPISRRDLMTRGVKTAAAAGVLAGSAGGVAGYLLRESQEPTAKTEIKWPLGRYLGYVWNETGNVDQNGWHITDRPAVSPVREFRPIDSVGLNMVDKFPDGYNDGKIVLRNSTEAPSALLEQGKLWIFSDKPYRYESVEDWNDGWLHKVALAKSEIKAKYVVPVFGDGVDLVDYTGEQNSGLVHSPEGQALRAGIWLALCDEHGNYVDPEGKPISTAKPPPYEQAPYFLSVQFASFDVAERPSA